MKPLSPTALAGTATLATLALLALLALVAQPVSATTQPKDTPVVVLTEVDFDSRVQKGTWLVDFYAPWCPHCKKLAPKFLKAAKELADWRETYDYHLAKVDCVAEEGLCNKLKVDGYPTLLVFQNSVRKEEYDGDRTYRDLMTYSRNLVIKYPLASNNGAAPPPPPPSAHAAAAAAPAAAADPAADPVAVAKPAKNAGAKSDADTPAAKKKIINDDAAPAAGATDMKKLEKEFEQMMQQREAKGLGKYGRVVDLTTENFEEMTSSSGPWLLEFYAPWCGHCKQLEPTYLELGIKLKDRMNVGRINADDETALRSRFEIRGYPTLMLYRSGSTTEYRGGKRGLAELEAFAMSGAAPAEVRHVSYAEFARVREEHDVAVVFAYGARIDKAAWRAYLDAADSWLLPSVTGIYASSDPQFAVGFKGAVLVYRRGYKDPQRFPENAGLDDDKVTADKKKEKDDADVDEDNMEETAAAAALDPQALTTKNIRAFVQSNRYPLLPELTDENAQDIMDGVSSGAAAAGGGADDDDNADARSRRRRVVVLGIIDPQSDDADSNKQALTQVAEAILTKHENQMHGITIQTVWLNGRSWGDYAKRIYGIRRSDLPRVVLSVPALEEYYALDAQGKPFELSPAAIEAALEDVVKQVAGVDGYRGKLVGVSTRGRVVSWIKGARRAASAVSPVVIVAAVVTTAVGLWFVCCRGGSGTQYQSLDQSKFD
ncbi:thioredoxin-like protein [Blastocladiella britannica]|nr:thioredoxin-like protein [Blastocladiella britannica]